MKVAIITGVVIIALFIAAYKLIDKVFEEMEKWEDERE